ncbi:MAG: ATP-binding protein [Kiritimatiellae bacterium]|nr:ATP-binding protein [Kiritimatiellia bacterium]
MVIRGARQVGKTSIVRAFAEANRLVLCEINLEKHLHLDEVFRTCDIRKINLEIEAITGIRPDKKGHLLFLDEIQSTPYALAALRYYYEEVPDLPVIATGSLLEFALSRADFSMPVGRVVYYHLFPLSFGEFLQAVSPDLLKYLDMISWESELPQSAHRKLLEKQREYLFVGGMPEAVSVYKETGSITEVSEIHRSIIDTYRDDFHKYASQKELIRLQKVFSQIPLRLTQKAKYSQYDEGARTDEIKHAMDLLIKARVCYPVVRSHCNGVPLNAEVDEKSFKLLFLDVGLACHMLGLKWKSIQEFTEAELVNEGGLAEQFIGQHLLNIGEGKQLPELHYWLREGKANNAEVDYVIAWGGRIYPVEVKAGKSGSLKSLHQYIFHKNSQLAFRFDVNQPGRQELETTIRISGTREETGKVAFSLISLPLYAVVELSRLCERL